MGQKRRTAKMQLYASFVGYQCAHPDCKQTGDQVQVHHILPVKNDGPNEYWNYICLCRKCHLKSRFHKNHPDNDLELFTWKSMQELELWGFTLDEQDPNYYENLKKLLSYRRETAKT